MPDTIDLVQAIISGDFESAETLASEILGQRAVDQVDAEKGETLKTFFNPEEK